jgi:hypothetical protein
MLAFTKHVKTVSGIDDVFAAYENIRALFLYDKTDAFAHIKPFNDTGSHCRHDMSFEQLRNSFER